MTTTHPAIASLNRRRLVASVAIGFIALLYLPNVHFTREISHMATCSNHSPSEVFLTAFFGIPVSLAYLAATVVAGVAWMMWTHRAYTNMVELFGATPKSTANMAAWSYLIPFANLVLPYTHLREVWDDAAPGPGPDGKPDKYGDPRNIIGWWASWLLMSFTINLPLLLPYSTSKSPVVMGLATGMTFGAASASIFLAHYLTRFQRERAEALGLSATPDAPTTPPETPTAPASSDAPWIDYYQEQ